ncbi:MULTISPECIES: hypothetical protein [unclassified Prochlorococcus]|uniref:hypothetical protein n=1 Tax=unclassified Prochlorococcus TaxID=2627481 RepID=UPI0005339F1D|nr:MULTISPECIES: hypothetical protein [unclassified Prochlorococcus]KGG15565.1 hypothetical protein EV06_1439 [Prochlorococcus sp. MIT 0602]KGG17845.1 hypothetical protein EV07_1287 [Prochlorococcus sp. MIT 0603]
MSIVQVKNLNRRLENMAVEATEELDKACGNQLWRNVGFEAFDGLKDNDRRAIANYYYGQLQTVRELQEVLNC